MEQDKLVHLHEDRTIRIYATTEDSKPYARGNKDYIYIIENDRVKAGPFEIR